MNKFSKLTILFTSLYVLIGIFIGSDIYTSDFMYKWLPNFSLLHLSVVGLLFLGLILASVVLGIIAIKKIYKTNEKRKWIIYLLTLWNLWALVSSVAVLIRL